MAGSLHGAWLTLKWGMVCGVQQVQQTEDVNREIGIRYRRIGIIIICGLSWLEAGDLISRVLLSGGLFALLNGL